MTGDHVIPLYIPQCGDCKFCKSPKTNVCSKIRETQGKGLMPDGTSRFTCKEQTIAHFMGCSTFSEYTVVADISLAKVLIIYLCNVYINLLFFIQASIISIAYVSIIYMYQYTYINININIDINILSLSLSVCPLRMHERENIYNDIILHTQ